MKNNLANGSVDHFRQSGEFKGKYLGYRAKKVLECAFRDGGGELLRSRISFGEQGLESYLFLAHALGSEFKSDHDGIDANFKRYLVQKIKSQTEPEVVKEFAKGLNSAKHSKILSTFRQIADEWRSCGPETTLGSLARSIDMTFEAKKEEVLTRFGDKLNNFTGKWGHQMLRNLIQDFNNPELNDGKKVLVIHDRLDKAEAVYDSVSDNSLLELGHATLIFADSKDELGVQIADMVAWIGTNAKFDGDFNHHSWLQKRFENKYSTQTFDSEWIADFDLSRVMKKT